MRHFFLALALCVGASATGQLPTYTVDPGQSLNDVLSISDFYRYPSFRAARVQFRDGFVKQAKMNLSWLNGRLEFLAPKGDTLMLEGIDQLAHVAIGTDTFFFYGGALEQVAAWKGEGRLLQRQQLREEGPVRMGGYGSNDPLGAIQSASLFEANSQMRSIVVQQRTTYIRDSKLYYWKDNTAAPVELDRRAVEHLFPARKSVIADYMRGHKVDFRVASQVKDLFDHLQGLP